MFMSFKTLQLLEYVCLLVFSVFYGNKQHNWVLNRQLDDIFVFLLID